jgi:DNA-binding transcriptional ArsR family regulator
MAAPTLNELTQLHASICQALADPKRLQILYALSEAPCHVNTLADELDMPQPTVSRHLRVLRNQSLVDTERNGTAIKYQLADTRIIDALDVIRQVMLDALTRQSKLVELE